ncbi:hypothetical protein H2199_008939 [Coniosporium tulheliwenetii]|uniref:Uncharacterized protein n=1 Tax=Coniosporium tulheliwenetii TaxID=3383036 RepID=A0ACC2YH01_9PEZI|nr:hypothetical protein H2199_008939 [Cladosporium sp. JES 115]
MSSPPPNNAPGAQVKMRKRDRWLGRTISQRLQSTQQAPPAAPSPSSSSISLQKPVVSAPAPPVSPQLPAVVPPPPPSSPLSPPGSPTPAPVAQGFAAIIGAKRNRALETAIERHIQQLPEAEKDAFRVAGTTEDNLLSRVADWDEAHKRESHFRPRAPALSKFLTFLERFMGGVAIGAQSNPDISCIVVGAVRVVIDLAVQFVTFFEKLTDMLGHFEDWLAPLAEYSKASRDVDLIHETVAKVYGDLLHFCSGARRVFLGSDGNPRPRTSLRIFLRVQWEPFETSFGSIERELQHHLNVVRHSAQAIQLNDSRRAELQAEMERQRIRQKENVAERESFLNWISKIDFDKIHDDVYATKHPGTGDWLLRTQEFGDWLRSPNSTVLWCHGKPGAGKTVLASNVLEYITDFTVKRGMRRETGVSFAYYNYRSPEFGDSSLIVSAFIKQLCRKKDTVPPSLLKLKHDSLAPSTATAQGLFIELARAFDEVFVIIDALDECPRDERHQILKFICEAGKSLPCAKIFVTSRRENDIVTAFKDNNIPTIEIKAENVAEDIRLFVENQVDLLRKGVHGKKLFLNSSALADKIIATLTNKAEGMFLWVKLQLESLCRISQARKDRLIEEALHTLPRGLDATYRRIIDQIDSQEGYMKDLALKCFMWVLYSKTPLRTQELRHALAISDTCKCREDLELDDIDVILDACANLFVEEYHGIRPIHYSVQEFFTNPPAGVLQKSCLKQIGEPDFVRIGWAGLKPPQYALHLACFAGLIEAATRLVEEGVDINESDEKGTGPLYYALDNKHIHIVELLLGNGADVNVQGGHFGNALQAASYYGYREVVELLLSKGADVNAQGGYYGNALQAASFNGNKEVVELLLSKGADVNAQGGKYGNALQAASFNGNKEVVELLLSEGADVNAQGGEYSNALHAASYYGYREVVELLLSKGADVNAQGGYYGNALQAASSNSNKEVVELLLSEGADVNALGGYYGNALHAASERGRRDVVDLLVSWGAHDSEADSEGIDDDGEDDQ